MPLQITTVVVSPFEQNCRIVKDVESGQGVIVDPGDDAERILEAAARSGARISHVLATHAHLDHVGAAHSNANLLLDPANREPVA